MRNLPVHWSEGMFLRPQHFQAADRFWHELLNTSQRWDNTYNYGIRFVEISREALANHQVEVSSIEARMSDGTVVSLGAGQGLDRVDLKPAFQNESEVTVFLALPKLSLGRANVSANEPTDGHRFQELVLETQDESRGGNDQDIAFLSQNLRVMLSTDESSGYELLPIAKVKRSGAEEATPELDTNYFPPMLAIDAWEPLALEIVRAIYDIVGEKIEVLASRATERRQNFTSPQPGDLEDLMMLTALNESYATLRCLGFARGIHPLVAYTELCRIVGKLSIFGDTRRVEEVPLYDHDDLATIFRWVRIRIEQLLGTRKKLGYEQRYFLGTQRGMGSLVRRRMVTFGVELVHRCELQQYFR